MLYHFREIQPLSSHDLIDFYSRTAALCLQSFVLIPVKFEEILARKANTPEF